MQKPKVGNKLSPLPWHLYEYKRLSAILDDNGHVVFGSLICNANPKDRANHRYVAKALGLGPCFQTGTTLADSL